MSSKVKHMLPKFAKIILMILCGTVMSIICMSVITYVRTYVLANILILYIILVYIISKLFFQNNYIHIYRYRTNLYIKKLEISWSRFWPKRRELHSMDSLYGNKLFPYCPCKKLGIWSCIEIINWHIVHVHDGS